MKLGQLRWGQIRWDKINDKMNACFLMSNATHGHRQIIALKCRSLSEKRRINQWIPHVALSRSVYHTPKQSHCCDEPVCDVSHAGSHPSRLNTTDRRTDGRTDSCTDEGLTAYGSAFLTRQDLYVSPNISASTSRMTRHNSRVIAPGCSLTDVSPLIETSGLSAP